MASIPAPTKVAEPLLTTKRSKPDASSCDQILSFKKPTIARQRCARLDRQLDINLLRSRERRVVSPGHDGECATGGCADGLPLSERRSVSFTPTAGWILFFAGNRDLAALLN